MFQNQRFLPQNLRFELFLSTVLYLDGCALALTIAFVSLRYFETS